MVFTVIKKNSQLLQSPARFFLFSAVVVVQAHSSCLYIINVVASSSASSVTAPTNLALLPPQPPQAHCEQCFAVPPSPAPALKVVPAETLLRASLRLLLRKRRDWCHFSFGFKLTPGCSRRRCVRVCVSVLLFSPCWRNAELCSHECFPQVLGGEGPR